MYVVSQPTAAHSRFHERGVASQTVKSMFNCLGITIETLQEANTIAQKELLRTGERWDLQPDNPLQTKMQEHKEMLIGFMRTLGMIDEVLPTHKEHAYALVMGALRSRAVLRLAYLKKLHVDGYRFKYVVLLGGMRELRPEEQHGLPANITTEAQMLEYEYNQLGNLEGTQLLVVNAPMVQKADGSFVRPITDDTLRHFAKIAPIEGSSVVISNNPYMVRQTKTAQRILDQTRFPITGTGAQANVDDNIVIIMDEFARTLYEESVAMRAAT
jgi:hypothetical protein